MSSNVYCEGDKTQKMKSRVKVELAIINHADTNQGSLLKQKLTSMNIVSACSLHGTRTLDTGHRAPCTRHRANNIITDRLEPFNAISSELYLSYETGDDAASSTTRSSAHKPADRFRVDNNTRELTEASKDRALPVAGVRSTTSHHNIYKFYINSVYCNLKRLFLNYKNQQPGRCPSI